MPDVREMSVLTVNKHPPGQENLPLLVDWTVALKVLVSGITVGALLLLTTVRYEPFKLPVH